MFGGYGCYGGGGGFGDGVSYYNQTFGGLGPELAASLDLHLQRISNSQAGYGFRTHAEVAVAIFSISYWYDEGGNLHTNFSLSATFYYSELAQGGLNDNARALIQDMGRRAPAMLELAIYGMGAVGAIIVLPYAAEAAITYKVLRNFSFDGSQRGAVS